MGPEVAAYEREFAQHFGARFGVMVNSGSSANLLAVAALVVDPRFALQRGDEVIVPAVSWATTYFPLAQYGLKLVFVDVDISTLNIDVAQVREAITPRTRAIFAVNLLGNPAELTVLRSIAVEHDLVLLEDNCESLGAMLDGKAAGTFGLMGTFSSFFSHHISTMEGGMILTDDEQLSQELTSLRAHGWTRELPDDNLVHSKSGDPLEDLFRFVLPGYNVRPLEMSGAIGREQVRKVPSIVRGRRQNAESFKDAFADCEHVLIQEERGESSWFGFSMVLNGALAGRRAEVANAFREAGVDVRPIVGGNFTKNPVMSYLDAIVPNDLPVADRVHEDGLFIGNHHFPINEQIRAVRKIVDRVADGN
ncbi:DegT/DnrJ/EryC1/StrS family aminotransferase [Chryseoglobus sp. 28M-23]|uniref:DegT/DnrJ/EryC1/StrS family aminotransferase n=1 Tax=Chryseoglobus sp. 28M-23 TaxID=2772253 RepID=UPI002102F900|nr:DegT/DnrJ/EryC1/StrS family aminotransferase [Chryseoglobus sp. 28M-23]